jgi:hypothetical protein
MKPEIFIYNPHYNSMIGKTFDDFFKGSKIPPKYFFLRNLIKKNKLSILISGNFSSLDNYFKNKITLKLIYFIDKYLFKYIQIYLWVIINGINPFKVNIIFDISRLQKKDILILYSNLNLDTKYEESENVQTIVNLDCKKLIHLSHYIFFTKIISENCKKIKNFHFMAENDLKKNSKFFKKYFSFYKNNFLSFPFVAGERFKNKKNFKDRKNKCISTGSFQIHEIIENKIDSVLEFYEQNTIHPIRKQIFNNKDIFKDYIECLNGPILKNQNFKIRKYYDFDIVEAFNSYKMFICGEELGDLPGISFAEGMKTGSVYLGNGDNHCYKDLGMIDGVHYISHSNNLIDIVDKIKFYQKNEDKLEKISRASYELASEKFSEEYVTKVFENNYNLI